MARTRELETEVVVEAKAEIGRIVADLQVIKGRALAIVRRLRAAAHTAPPVTINPDGTTVSVETYLADLLETDVEEQLEPAIRVLAEEATRNWRVEVLDIVAASTCSLVGPAL